MHKVLFDCDNTMGVKGKDVDDGLALLYLLGRSDIDLLGVTTTFGNSTIDIVHNNTIQMFKELGITDIPLIKGAASQSYRHSSAAEFLVQMADKYPRQITLLATGSLSNLYGAYDIDPKFFSKLKAIVVMGGITEPLIINNINLDELNFSCDPEAAFHVLSSNTRVSVLTGHICLHALFGEKEYKRLTGTDNIKIYRYIDEKSRDWYRFITEQMGITGFYNWDIVAAVYITHPELFDENLTAISSTPLELSRGFLQTDRQSENNYIINIPTLIKNTEMFNGLIFEAWANVNL